MEPNDIRFFIKTDENISTEVGDLIKNHHRLSFVTVSDSDEIIVTCSRHEDYRGSVIGTLVRLELDGRIKWFKETPMPNHCNCIGCRKETA